MSALTLALVILAAALHACWNLLSKRAASGGRHFVFAYRAASVVLYAPWVAYVLWSGEMQWSLTVVGFIALSSTIHLCYSLSLQRGYQVADLSVVYPVARGTGPLLASIAAILWLGEASSLYSLTGIACVVGGIFFLAMRGSFRRFADPAARAGIGWGVLIGVFIACYSVSDAYSVQTLLVVPVILDWFSALGNVVIMAPGAWVQRRTMLNAMRGHWRSAWVVGLISPLAYILVLYALQHGALVSQVAPLREMSMMMATVAGFLWLGEKVSTVRLAGCGLIMAGTVLLATS